MSWILNLMLLTVDSCMDRNVYVLEFYKLLQFKTLNIFKALTSETTSISISLDPLFLCLLFSQCWLIYFRKLRTKTGRDIFSRFLFLKSHSYFTFFRRTCTKVKACNQIQFLHQNVRAIHLITLLQLSI